MLVRKEKAGPIEQAIDAKDQDEHVSAAFL
jgi:hypothetical protein